MNSKFDYESKATYAEEFENVRRMSPFDIGSSLGFIVGLVRSLDFFNATLMEITTHHTKLAVHQYIGMTTRQLQTMLALERPRVE